jgi:hypothetical protein
MAKYRTKKDWSKINRTSLGVIYTCPNCHNMNSKPVTTTEGKPYCSSCLINFSKVFIMTKREMIEHFNRSLIKKPFRG